MFQNFDDAVEYAKRIKANPELISEHYKEQNEIYKKAVERRRKHNLERNKSAKF